MIMDIEISLLSRVIEYNKERYKAFSKGIILPVNLEYERILKARYMKVSRVKKRLLYLLLHYKYIWFCTFTFSDYYLNKSDRTKKDLIKNAIKTLDFKYILNIDYGKTTEREHYHCIIATNWNCDVNKHIKNLYPCHCLAIKCNNSSDDIKRLTKYINKLSNHCVKSTCKRQRVIYNFKGFESLAPDVKSQNLASSILINDLLNVTLT